MISFFQDGSFITGVDYTYSPETETRETVIVAYEKIRNTETGEEEEKAVTTERIIKTPAKGREDCIHVCQAELPPGHRPELTQEDWQYTVYFVELPTEEAPTE